MYLETGTRLVIAFRRGAELSLEEMEKLPEDCCVEWLIGFYQRNSGPVRDDRASNVGFLNLSCDKFPRLSAGYHLGPSEGRMEEIW